MDFLNHLTENGFTVKCIFGGDDYQNQKGSFNIIITDESVIPSELTHSITYLIATIATHFIDDVSDPFNYNHDLQKSVVFINNHKYEIVFDSQLNKLFNNYQSEDNDGNETFTHLQNETFNHILEQLQVLNGANYIFQDKFEKLKSMSHVTHTLCAIRNNKKYEIGIGKIFSPN